MSGNCMIVRETSRCRSLASSGSRIAYTPDPTATQVAGCCAQRRFSALHALVQPKTAYATHTYRAAGRSGQAPSSPRLAGSTNRTAHPTASRHLGNTCVRMLAVPARRRACGSIAICTATLGTFGGAYVFPAISRNRCRWRALRHHRIPRRATTARKPAIGAALRASRWPTSATSGAALRHRRRRVTPFRALGTTTKPGALSSCSGRRRAGAEVYGDRASIQGHGTV